MDKYIDVNLEKCTACRLCEFACSTHNFGEINPARSRIKVTIVSKDFFYYPNVCQQCGKAPCMEACPQEGALVRNETSGAVEVVATECIGCRMCVRACPFGAMGFDKMSKLADKCDLCGGDPQCVQHCFYGTIQFKDIDQTVFDLNRAYAHKVKAAKSVDTLPA